ncbi:MAG: hypothetical protein ABIR71_03825 [Chthoniobacterales bacterium]
MAGTNSEKQEASQTPLIPLRRERGGEDGALVVDSGLPDAAAKIVAELRKIGPGPIKKRAPTL